MRAVEGASGTTSNGLTKRVRFRRRAFATTGLAGLFAAALAQPAAAQDDDGLYWLDRLGEVTVLGTRTPVEIADSPATVSVITSEEIADRLVTDIKELVLFEPGVTVRRAPARFGAAFGSTGRAGNEDFNIRGIGGDRVLIQVDGIRTPQGFSFGAHDAGRGGYTDVGLVKRVEILRGPGSALYGSDGLSGVVSFVTSDPDDILRPGQSIGGFARAQYSSADEEFTELATIAGRAGDWSAMLAYTRRDFEELDNKGDVGGIGEDRTRPNPQDGSSDAFLGKLVWRPGGGHRIRLTGEYLATELETEVLSGEGPATPFGPFPVWIVDNLDTRDETERVRASLDWSWSGDGFIDDAEAAVYWQEGEDVQFSDEDRSPVSATPRPDRERLNIFENRLFGFTAQATSAFATGAIGHRLVFGGDISWLRQTGVRDGTEPPFGETFPTSAFPETDFMLGGVFVGDEIALFDDRLILYPALRFDFYELDPKNDPLYPVLSQAGQKDERFSPKFGAVAKLGPRVRLFTNYAQGFRAPTPSQVNNGFSNISSGYISIANPDLGPERSESIEAGIRVGGPRLSFEVTAFHADYKDFISQEVVAGSFRPTDPAVFQFINFGRAEVEGVEARADFNSENGMFARFAIAYAKGEQSVEGGPDEPLDTIEPLNMVLGLGYRHPERRFGGELIVSHNARKSIDRISDTQCNGDCFRPDAATILDATAFVRVAEAPTLRAGVFNITDERYAYWSDVRGLSADDAARFGDAFTRPGRNASVSVSYRF